MGHGLEIPVAEHLSVTPEIRQWRALRQQKLAAIALPEPPPKAEIAINRRYPARLDQNNEMRPTWLAERVSLH